MVYRARCSAWEEGGGGETGVPRGQPALCSLLLDSEPLKEGKPQNRGSRFRLANRKNVFI